MCRALSPGQIESSVSKETPEVRKKRVLGHIKFEPS